MPNQQKEGQEWRSIRARKTTLRTRRSNPRNRLRLSHTRHARALLVHKRERRARNVVRRTAVHEHERPVRAEREGRSDACLLARLAAAVGGEGGELRVELLCGLSVGQGEGG